MSSRLSSTRLPGILMIAILVVIVGCAPTTQATIAPTTANTATVEATDQSAEAATEQPTQSVDATEQTTEVVASVDAATCTKLDLNTLTEDQLMSTIPDFSSRMVREFMEYRPYVSIQQFRREIGKYVDTAQVTTWEQYVYVPVDPNNSDADTLAQIPGVDATIAAALIAGRPYDSNAAFLTAFTSQVSADQLAQASCYLAEA